MSLLGNSCSRGWQTPKFCHLCVTITILYAKLLLASFATAQVADSTSTSSAASPELFPTPPYDFIAESIGNFFSLLVEASPFPLLLSPSYQVLSEILVRFWQPGLPFIHFIIRIGDYEIEKSVQDPKQICFLNLLFIYSNIPYALLYCFLK